MQSSSIHIPLLGKDTIDNAWWRFKGQEVPPEPLPACPSRAGILEDQS